MRQDEQQESFKVYRLSRLRERYAADEIDVETYEREVDDVLHGRVPGDKGWATTYSLDEMRRWAAHEDAGGEAIIDRIIGVAADISDWVTAAFVLGCVIAALIALL